MLTKRTFSLLSVLALASCGLWVSLAVAAVAAWPVGGASAQAEPGVTLDRIATISLPSGYSEAYVVDLGNLQAIGFDGADGRSHIILLQGPAVGVERGRELRAAAPREIDHATGLILTEIRSITVRGQAATLTQAEGSSHDGTPYHEATVAFHGRSGPALLIVSGPSSGWDPAVLDALITSIQ